jgi:hypothetical protein
VVVSVLVIVVVALGDLGVIMDVGAVGRDFFPRLPRVLMSGVGGHGARFPPAVRPDTDATRRNLYVRTCEHIAIASKLQR